MNKYQLIATSSYGDTIDLWNDTDIVMTSIEGISMNSEVTTTALSNLDGSSYRGSRVPEREISIVVQYRQETGNAELAKLRMYRIFQPRSEIRMQYKTANQDKYIVGYCSKCDTPPNAYPMLTQLVIKCDDPYWKNCSSSLIQLCGINPLFEFINNSTELNRVEFSNTKVGLASTFDYYGDTETGLNFTFNVNDACTTLGVEDFYSGDKIVVNGPFNAGDVLTICTIPRKKSVKLFRGATYYDYFVNVAAGSIFPKLSRGRNKLNVVIGDGTYNNVDVLCTYETLYGGV